MTEIESKAKSRQCLILAVESLRNIHHSLGTIAAGCEDGGEGRIAFEVKQTMCQITHTIELAEVYIRGDKLPTLADMRGIFRSSDYV